MPERVSVYAILDTDKKIVEICSSEPLAKEAARAWDDWHGHGSATVTPREALKIGEKFYLLANDYGPEVQLDSTKAAQEAKVRLGARAKLTDGEILALGIKG